MLEDKLAHKENVIRAIQSDNPLVNMQDFDTSESFKLKEENEKLKQIVKQMREEVEILAMSDLVPVKQTNHENNRENFTKNNSPNEFEEDLKRQVLDLKQKKIKIRII